MDINAHFYKKCPRRSKSQARISSKQKLYNLTNGSKSDVLCFRQIDIVHCLNFSGTKVLDFLNFLTGLVLVSYKLVSYKQCVVVF